MTATADPPAAAIAATATPAVVIDTNVVLDWLLFRDAALMPLAQAIEARTLKWIATPAMLAEYRRIFTIERAAPWGTGPASLESALRQWATPDNAALSPCSLRCTDPDDQMFIDLAMARRAKWLLTRDRALLKLARRARALGVQVLKPAAWAAMQITEPGDSPQRAP